MVSLTNIGQKVDLVKLLEIEKKKGFFIEDNHSIQQLHILLCPMPCQAQ
jgi:hypothetical protein